MSLTRRVRNAESAKRARSKRKMTQSLHETIAKHAEQLAKAFPESTHAQTVTECLASLRALSTRRCKRVDVPPPKPLVQRSRKKRKSRAGKQQLKGVAPKGKLDSSKECAEATPRVLPRVLPRVSPRSPPKQGDAMLSPCFVGL